MDAMNNSAAAAATAAASSFFQQKVDWQPSINNKRAAALFDAPTPKKQSDQNCCCVTFLPSFLPKRLKLLVDMEKKSDLAHPTNRNNDATVVVDHGRHQGTKADAAQQLLSTTATTKRLLTVDVELVQTILAEQSKTIAQQQQTIAEQSNTVDQQQQTISIMALQQQESDAHHKMEMEDLRDRLQKEQQKKKKRHGMRLRDRKGKKNAA
eukprot:scaffold2784_cov109-Cylindrotheca_fusiformis.AAC.11